MTEPARVSTIGSGPLTGSPALETGASSDIGRPLLSS